ncbi:MAG: DUF1501 domain-containing protein [Armatimonadetes bacterium]|nr:DUF1501 domain-containing protein [Armatimonadota bacterium]
MTRRHFFGRAATGIGVLALGDLLNADKAFGAVQQAKKPIGNSFHGVLKEPHFPPKVKRVIYLFQSGAPSHIDLFDHKPELKQHHGQELPASVRNGQRITGMTSGQSSFPCVFPIHPFKAYGKNNTHITSLMPHIGGIIDDVTLIRSMHTEAINHDPAITFIQTGSQQPGRPSIGAWMSYGLGSENSDLPAYIVLISQGFNKSDQPLFGRLWGPGFLPSVHQGVKMRSSGDPVLYLGDPPGMDKAGRREMLDSLAELNRQKASEAMDPEINTRIAQYEMAFRMQTSVPDLMDLSKESEATLDMYGPEARKPGTFAANCLLARRLSERGVRFVQLFHKGWDHHGNLPTAIKGQSNDVDQPAAALVKDLEQRGLLDETLIIFGGEFGRTVYSQGTLTADNYGRDHHGRCFSIWLAGGGIKKGLVYGKTDDFCYNIVENPVHIHDLNATIMHLLGVNHERLTFRYQGRDFRLTDVAGEVVHDILA